MNENLINLLYILVNDSKFRKNFIKQKNLNDLYNLCLSVEKGYDLNEFKEFLKSIISLNCQVSNKIEKISVENLLDIAGGNSNSSKSRFLASLMGSILLAQGTSSAANFQNNPSDALNSNVLMNQQIINEKSLDFEEKIQEIKNSASESLKAIANTAEECLGKALDVITPKAKAATEPSSKRVKPSIYSWPRATNVNVGKTVSDSKLIGGSASVSGRFVWLYTVKDEKLTSEGKVSYICQFIPDDTEKYLKVTQTVSFNVLEAETNIISSPTTSTITYGQPLSQVSIYGGKANVPGRFSWVNPSIIPEVGNHKYSVEFIPYDSNYKSKIISINVKVDKATPTINCWPSAWSITDGQSLSDSWLSGGSCSNVSGTFAWADCDIKPKIGIDEFTVKFTPFDSNYKCVYKKIPVNVKKVDVRINWPSASDIVYGQKISDSRLKYGSANIKGHFEWDYYEANSKPSVGTNKYKITFKPDDSANYNEYSQYVDVKVKRATPSVIISPSASEIYYGQKLRESNLSGYIINGVSGSIRWENEDEVLTAGKHSRKVIFTPNDTYNYNTISLNVGITVKKAPVNIVSYPSASSITYGDSLRSSNIFNFKANVPGTIEWTNPNEYLKNAGTYMKLARFTPYDSNNYQSIDNINIPVTVEKATPKLKNKHFEKTYKPGMTLNDVSLPYGWVWENPKALLNDIKEFKFVAKHLGSSNYHKNSEAVTININKAEPTLSLPDITYDENRTLKDIELPKGWHWINESETPTASKSIYKASFSSQEAGTKFYYDRNEINLKMNVKKADPKVKEWPLPTKSIYYGDTLKSEDLTNGIAEVAGTFVPVTNTSDLKAGNHQISIKFVPNNSNYETKIRTISINILKNMVPAGAPQLYGYCLGKSDTTIDFKFFNISTEELEFSKDGGKTWQDSCIFTNLTPETSYDLVCRYKDTESRCASKIRSILKVSTKASAPPAPTKIKIKEKTNHKIVFEDDGGNLEFSKDGGKTWQYSPIFEGLNASEKYGFKARLRETEDHVAGAPSEVLTVKTRSWAGNVLNSIKNKIKSKIKR